MGWGADGHQALPSLVVRREELVRSGHETQGAALLLLTIRPSPRKCSSTPRVGLGPHHPVLLLPHPYQCALLAPVLLGI